MLVSNHSYIIHSCPVCMRAGYAYLTSHALFISWSELCLGTQSTMTSWDLVQSADRCSSFREVRSTAVFADTRFYFFCIYKKDIRTGAARLMRCRERSTVREDEGEIPPHESSCVGASVPTESKVCIWAVASIVFRSLGNILAYCCSHYLNRETPAGLLAAL